jgi:antitoxin (DNA-binding transcriptional repressor) of toxin-antitoxin stability system
MLTVNIHDAKTQLSKLIAMAVNGQPFIIAKAGKPLVKVEAIQTEVPPRQSRLGGLVGKMKLPDDFDTMFNDDIAEMFYGKK